MIPVCNLEACWVQQFLDGTKDREFRVRRRGVSHVIANRVGERIRAGHLASGWTALYRSLYRLGFVALRDRDFRFTVVWRYPPSPAEVFTLKNASANAGPGEDRTGYAA